MFPSPIPMMGGPPMIGGPMGSMPMGGPAMIGGPMGGPMGGMPMRGPMPPRAPPNDDILWYGLGVSFAVVGAIIAILYFTGSFEPKAYAPLPELQDIDWESHKVQCDLFNGDLNGTLWSGKIGTTEYALSFMDGLGTLYTMKKNTKQTGPTTTPPGGKVVKTEDAWPFEFTWDRDTSKGSYTWMDTSKPTLLPTLSAAQLAELASGTTSSPTPTPSKTPAPTRRPGRLVMLKGTKQLMVSPAEGRPITEDSVWTLNCG